MKKQKNIIIYFISFFVPILLIILTFLFLKLNDNNFSIEKLLVSDMKSQYISFYNYIRDVFLGNSSIFYSFSRGLGGNMTSTIGYYLASPLNILYLFVSKVDIPLMVFITYTIKISLCSLFMCIFLSNKFGHKYTNILFSLFYAFIGFTSVYYFNNMWLDVIYMTPLVILGIDKLFQGKSTFYIIMLALSMIFNFYMAYMLCIFCAIYFLYKLFNEYRVSEFNLYKKILFKFILSSILSFFLASIFLFPLIYNMRSFHRYPLDTELLNISFTELINNFFNVISKSYSFSHEVSELAGRERPVIYVNLFSIILLFFYFFNKKISSKEKLLSFFVVFLFLLSFTIPALSLIWQGFSFPNGYIGRFSYLYCFFIIYLSCKCFYNKSKYNIKPFIIISLIYIAVAIYIESLNFEFLITNKIIFNCMLFVIYIILYFLYCNKDKKIYLITIFFISIFELYGNYYNNIYYFPIMSYSEFYTKTCPQINKLEKNFYRIEGDYTYNFMDSYICNTNGIKIDSSASDKKIYKFLYNNGFSMDYIKINYNFNELPVIESLLGVKYILSTSKAESSVYNYHDSFISINNEISDDEFDNKKNKQVYIYENPYALSLGYLIENNLNNLSFVEDNNNSFENLNLLVSKLSGIEEKVFKPLNKVKIGKNLYKFDVNVDDEFLFFTIKYKLYKYYNEYGDLYINDKYIDTLDTSNIGIIKIKNIYKDSNSIFKIIENDEGYLGDANLYTFDLKTFEKAINKLKANQLTNVVIDGNCVSGEINSPKESTLFLSIPYEKGWNVYVNGKKQKYYEIADGFVGINLKEGKQKIEMKFYPPGLLVGGIITILSIMVLVLNIYINKKISR